MIRDPRDIRSPTRLDVLGRISLRSGEDELRAVLVQPKRFALLVYIALRRPGGVLRRDELLGAFWSDSTEDRARASLRQALRFLRRHLGSGVLVNRGEAEIGIGPDALECDALDFLRALDRGEDEAAVKCYGGVLLPGFALEGAYEFDRWLHGERLRLRVAAIEAALRLGERAEQEREFGQAAERVRWALRLEPTDEAVGRRLISLLVRDGNRPAAVAAYEALAERLVRELDLEPSPETVELLAAVRSGSAAPRPGVGGTRSLSPQRVLVVDLENLTNDRHFDALGRLAADALAHGLATVPGLEVVPPTAARVVPAPAKETVDPDAGLGADPTGLPGAVVELARRTGAGTVVTGAFHLEEDRMRFQVRLTDVARGTLLQGPDPIETDPSTPLNGVEQLRERVMTSLGAALTRRAVHIRGAARPPGMGAFRAYLEGLERFIRREWRAALVHFRRSAELEPGYALPRVVCSIALWNLGELEQARATAMEAEALRDSLGRFERAVLDMVLAWLRGDWSAAHRAAAEQAEIAPGSIPHFQVAEEARRLNRPREAREVLDRLDPETGELRGWIFYWIEVSTAHHLLGDHRRELEAASRCRRMHPDDPAAALLEIRAFAGLGRVSDVIRVAEQALSSPAAQKPLPGELLVEAALELRAHDPRAGQQVEPGPGDAADAVDAAYAANAAQRLVEQAVEWYREQGGADESPSMRRELGRALYHAGQHDRARSIFEELSRNPGGGVEPIGYHHGHLQAHLDEGYLAVIAVQEGEIREATRRCTSLEQLEGPFLYGAHWFWLAAVAALADDRERAVRMLRRAFADGLPMDTFIHTDPHLARLRGYEPFERLMRPRG